MNIKAVVDLNFNFNNAEIENAVQQELNETAKQIQREAKANCPVYTGYLRNSIKADINDMEVDIGTDCYYAGYVHDGTYKMPARPFLDSAANSVLDGIEDEIADAIARLL